MAKLTLNNISTGEAQVAINANSTLIEQALENTLSRDGAAPNQMEADLDMNGYSIFNAGLITRASTLAVSYEDLRFPATAVNPPGQAEDPDWDQVTPGWRFDASTTEVIHLIAQLPHQWKVGTTLGPHVHWMKTTSASGNVLWRFQYKWAPIGGVLDADWTTADVTTTVGGTPDTDTANQHLISSFGDIDTTGKQISDVLLMRFARIGSDGSDTYGADARFLEFDIHYAIDGFGSDGVFTKSY